MLAGVEGGLNLRGGRVTWEVLECSGSQDGFHCNLACCRCA